MTGRGARLAPLILAEIKNIRSFHSEKAFNVYADNDAIPYQFGLFKNHNYHISQLGIWLSE